MRLAISNIGWEANENQAVYGLMQKYGFTGLEIAPTKIWENPFAATDRQINKLLADLKDLNIEVAAMQALLFGHPELTIFQDKTTRNTTLAYLKRMLDLGRKLNAKSLVFGSPKNRLTAGLAKETVNKIAADFFNELGDYAAKYNIYFCLEPNPKEYGADFLISTAEAIEFVKKLNNPAVKINFDTGTAIINQEDFAADLAANISLIGHFHVSEPFLEVISNKIQKSVAEFLQKNKYQNWVSIEMKSKYPQSNTINIKKSLSLIRSQYI